MSVKTYGSELLSGEGRVIHRPSQLAECFTIEKSVGRSFDLLTDEEAGQVIKGVFSYLDGDYPILTGRKAKFVFNELVAEIEQEACSKYIGDFLF